MGVKECCPKCGEEMRCPCPSCSDRNKGRIVWEWIGGDIIACGKCGFEQSADWWEERSMLGDRPVLSAQEGH